MSLASAIDFRSLWKFARSVTRGVRGSRRLPVSAPIEGQRNASTFVPRRGCTKECNQSR